LHELGIARDICRAAGEYAAGRKITFMKVEVGALAGVAADALDLCIRDVAREMGLGETEEGVEEAEEEAKGA